jgi:hypothetical protein
LQFVVVFEHAADRPIGERLDSALEIGVVKRSAYTIARPSSVTRTRWRAWSARSWGCAPVRNDLFDTPGVARKT